MITENEKTKKKTQSSRTTKKNSSSIVSTESFENNVFENEVKKEKRHKNLSTSLNRLEDPELDIMQCFDHPKEHSTNWSVIWDNLLKLNWKKASFKTPFQLETKEVYVPPWNALIDQIPIQYKNVYSESIDICKMNMIHNYDYFFSSNDCITYLQKNGTKQVKPSIDESELNNGRRSKRTIIPKYENVNENAMTRIEMHDSKPTRKQKQANLQKPTKKKQKLSSSSNDIYRSEVEFENEVISDNEIDAGVSMFDEFSNSSSESFNSLLFIKNQSSKQVVKSIPTIKPVTQNRISTTTVNTIQPLTATQSTQSQSKLTQQSQIHLPSNLELSQPNSQPQTTSQSFSQTQTQSEPTKDPVTLINEFCLSNDIMNLYNIHHNQLLMIIYIIIIHASKNKSSSLSLNDIISLYQKFIINNQIHLIHNNNNIIDETNLMNLLVELKKLKIIIDPRPGWRSVIEKKPMDVSCLPFLFYLLFIFVL